MGVVYCPRCQGRVAHTAGQTYCPRCGWNRHVAALQIRSLQRLLPIFLLPLLAFGFLLVAHEDDWRPFLYVLLIGALLYLVGVRALGRSLRRLEQLQPMDRERLKLGGLLDPVEEEEQRARTLVALPRPRPVYLSSSGRYYIGGVVLAGAVFEAVLLWHLVPLLLGVGWRAALTAEGWFLGAGVLFFPTIVAIVTYGLARQKNLVVNGEAALARITRQWRVRGNSWIRYEFKAGSATIAREAVDASHRLYAGMTVPVFYDADDLSRHVACCAAYYQIVFPGTE
jgi:hypothetical protein